MSRNAVVTFALRHNIPRINRHHEVYYSRAHIDAIKEKQEKLNPDYYTYDEITEKYRLTKLISATMSTNTTSNASSKEAEQWCYVPSLTKSI